MSGLREASEFRVERLGSIGEYHLDLAAVLYDRAAVTFGSARPEKSEQQAFRPFLGLLEGEVLQGIGADIPCLIPLLREAGIGFLPVVHRPPANAGRLSAAGDAPAEAQSPQEAFFCLRGSGAVTTLTMPC